MLRNITSTLSSSISSVHQFFKEDFKLRKWNAELDRAIRSNPFRIDKYGYAPGYVVKPKQRGCSIIQLMDLFDFIKNNHHIEHVYLGNYFLDDDKAQVVAYYIRKNLPIVSLNINENQISEKIYTKIIEALRVNTSLKDVYLGLVTSMSNRTAELLQNVLTESNHTIKKVGLRDDGFQIDRWLHNQIDKQVEMNQDPSICTLVRR